MTWSEKFVILKNIRVEPFYGDKPAFLDFTLDDGTDVQTQRAATKLEDVDDSGLASPTSKSLDASQTERYVWDKKHTVTFCNENILDLSIKFEMYDGIDSKNLNPRGSIKYEATRKLSQLKLNGEHQINLTGTDPKTLIFDVLWSFKTD